MKKETKNSKNQEEALDKIDIAPAPADGVNAETPKKTAEEKEGKVGLLLKEVRMKQGKTIPEIAQELCIRKIYLIAIEESDYNNIPEYPYGIGFIRSYADYLGLDGVNIVQMYKEEAEANLRKNNPYFVIEPQVEATVPSKKYLMISLLAVIAIYFAWSMYNRMNDDSPVDEEVVEETINSENGNSGETPADYPLKVEDFSTTVETTATVENLPVVDAVNAENNNPQVVVKEGNFVAEPAAKVEPAQAVVPSIDVKPAKEVAASVSADKGLVLKIKKDTWVEVKNDQKLYLSKVLVAGDSYAIPSDKNLRLSVGKSEGIDVTLDGKVIYNIAPTKKMNISIDEILAQANH